MKLKGFQKLTFIDRALQTWFNALQIGQPNSVEVPLRDALDRVLAEDLIAKEALPRFDKSAMDGYAVNSNDLVGTTQSKPVVLQLIQSEQVNAKEAKQVWTGNPIPKGADAVVMLEDTQNREGQLEVWGQLVPWANVSKIGEDVKNGDLLVKAGTRLNPYHLGLAAALGHINLKVSVKSKIAIIATGNEIVEVGTERASNQIYDSNKIFSLCSQIY